MTQSPRTDLCEAGKSGGEHLEAAVAELRKLDQIAQGVEGEWPVAPKPIEVARATTSYTISS